MLKQVVILIFLMAVLQLPAQTSGPSNRNNGVEPIAAAGTIKGRVVHGNDNQPVEFTSVALYKQKDSSLVGGTITDEQGYFLLKSIPFGQYYAEFTYVGYKKSSFGNIVLSPESRIADLGEIKVEAEATILNEVTVKGTSDHIEYKLDKKVINVSSDLVSSGGTAVDILENTPSVQTDIEGNVQLRGSSNFTVLINGKPSVLQGSEALQQIPASSIQTIEIITNPSAKYDPDGVAGIINVVMKKQRFQGFSGLITVSGATQPQYSSNVLLNYRTNKLNIYGGGDWLDHQYFGTMNNERENFIGQDTSLFLMNYSDNNMKRTGMGLKGGLDYTINDHNSLSGSVNYGLRNFGRYSDTRSHEYWSPAGEESYLMKYSNGEGINKYYNLNSDFRHTFEDQGHELTSSVYFSSGTGENTSDYHEAAVNSSWELLNPGESYTIRRQVQNSNNNELRTKLDYVKPFSGKSKLEAGYQGRYATSTDTLAVRNYDPDLQRWINEDASYDVTRFSDNIQAVYGTYSNTLSFFDYQLGLRAEYYNRNLVKALLADSSIGVNRFDLFPTLHLSKQLKNQQQIQVSYSRRVERPNGHDIDPFPRFMDSLNYMVGNPSLQPEFTNSFEVNYQKRIKGSFYSVEAYARQTNNLIERIQIIEDNNVMRHTFANVDKDLSIGIELMANLQLFKWWQLNLTTTGYHYQLFGNVGEQDIAASTFTGNIRMNSNFSLKTGTKIQLMAFYSAPNVEPQERENGMFMANLGVRQDFFKNKLNATLQFRDMFNTMGRTGSSYGPGWNSKMEFRRKGQALTLTLSYRFNNFKQDRRSGQEMGEGDFGGGGEME
ncbi:MAG: TonB-dependent receptor [Bacteroidales bacterium]